VFSIVYREFAPDITLQLVKKSNPSDTVAVFEQGKYIHPSKGKKEESGENTAGLRRNLG